MFVVALLVSKVPSVLILIHVAFHRLVFWTSDFKIIDSMYRVDTHLLWVGH